MRFLKLFLISLVILFITLLFVFSLFPSHIRISRVINIRASKEKLAGLVNDMGTWPEWNELIRRDSTHPLVSRPPSGEGAFIQTDKIKVIITRNTTDSINTSWLQNNKDQYSGGFAIAGTEAGNVTIEWYFDFYIKWYPWQKLGMMFYDKQLGPLMEESLLNLKNYTESH